MLPSSGPPGGALWPLGAALQRSWDLLDHFGSHIEAFWGILSHLGGHLGPSQALLESSRAILDAPTRRGLPRAGPGEGAG
eukprot:4068710-Pyramimonas_sp.AAC.1